MKPFLLILSAPSGAGKTTIARAVLDSRDDVVFSVSATTRTPREGERDGTDYHFLTRDEFQRRVDADEFVEWAEYGDHLYGTLKEHVDRVLATGCHALLDIDVQGAEQIRARSSNVVSVFILPPSVEVLVDRLANRSSESPTALRQRFLRAVDEVAEAGKYDYIVVNDDRARAVADVARIIDAEACRSGRQVGLNELTQEFRVGLAREAERLGKESQ